LGLTIGSSISNILLAFSLGLLLHSTSPEGNLSFSLSAKVYSLALLIISSFYTILAFTGFLDLTGGIFLMVLFAVYLVCACEGVYDGILKPEGDDEINMRGPDEEGQDDYTEGGESERERQMHRDLHIAIFPSTMACHPDELQPLVPNTSRTPAESIQDSDSLDDIWYIALKAGFGFIVLSISSFVLAHVATKFAPLLHVSDTVFGITVLSFFTTISVKSIPAIMEWRRNKEIMVASTACPNVFLLTFCAGLIFASSGTSEELETHIIGFEVWASWGCSLLLLIIVLAGGKKWMGAIAFGLYCGWIGTELLVYRR
jgi:Ca2+/Na+ antiporter